MNKFFNIPNVLRYQQAGNISEIKKIYKKLIEKNPKEHRLIYQLGLAEYQEGNYQIAIAYFQQAIEISSLSPTYYKELGNCFKHLKMYDLAVSNYQKALRIDPQNPDVYYDFGNLYLIKGDIESAIENFRKVILYDPGYLNAYINLGIALEKKGRSSDAVSIFSKALSLSPENELVYHNLGNSFCSLGKIEAAIDAYEKAIALKPQFAEAHFNLGMAYWEMMLFQKAIQSFENAINANQRWDQPYLLLGNIYQEKGKYDTAIRWFERALKLNPNSALAHNLKGQCLSEMKNQKEALFFFKQALNIDSELQSAYIDLIKVMLNSCTWSDFERYSAKLDQLSAKAISNGISICETPFLNLIRHSDKKLNFQIAKFYTQSIQQKIKKYNIIFNFKNRYLSEEKIHLGYLSNNFRNHPTANLLMDIFKLHNREMFKVSCYSYGPDDQSYQREHIKTTCDEFIDLHNLNNASAAKRIFEDKVDILIDLAAYLKDSRIEIAAFRPAPIQIKWLGMAGTTGADFFDYLITDQIVTPEDNTDFYSEKFIYLPECYQVNSNLAFKLQKTSKEQWGLPPNCFVFCCFCSAYKIDPHIFQCWLSVLKKVPNSLLWLMVESDLAEENLRIFAEANGVTPERIVFANRLPRKDHLQRLSCADLALDTVMVSGAATTSDALWAGVPVLTVKGKHFASRMSASILYAVGLSELVFNNIKDYHEMAIQYACSTTLLDKLKRKLAHQQKASSLFDTNNGIKLLENAYEKAWSLYKSGKQPQLLKVY